MWCFLDEHCVDGQEGSSSGWSSQRTWQGTISRNVIVRRILLARICFGVIEWRPPQDDGSMAKLLGGGLGRSNEDVPAPGASGALSSPADNDFVGILFPREKISGKL
jgi:hypothetical protein